MKSAHLLYRYFLRPATDEDDDVRVMLYALTGPAILFPMMGVLLAVETHLTDFTAWWL